MLRAVLFLSLLCLGIGPFWPAWALGSRIPDDLVQTECGVIWDGGPMQPIFGVSFLHRADVGTNATTNNVVFDPRGVSFELVADDYSLEWTEVEAIVFTKQRNDNGHGQLSFIIRGAPHQQRTGLIERACLTSLRAYLSKYGVRVRIDENSAAHLRPASATINSR